MKLISGVLGESDEARVRNASEDIRCTIMTTPGHVIDIRFAQDHNPGLVQRVSETAHGTRVTVGYMSHGGENVARTLSLDTAPEPRSEWQVQ